MLTKIIQDVGTGFIPVRNSGQQQGLSLHEKINVCGQQQGLKIKVSDNHKGCPYKQNKIPNVGTGFIPVRNNGQLKIKISDNHKGCPYTKNKNINQLLLPKRKTPRLKDFDYSLPYVYFVTICAKNKNRFFTEKEFNKKILDCLVAEKNKTKVNVYVYCLMPDHLHLLISPANSGISISRFIGGFKSKTTRLGWEKGIKKLWQERFYDHILRRNEDIEEIAQYILNNPVRKGMVESYEDYEFCGLLDEIPQ